MKQLSKRCKSKYSQKKRSWARSLLWVPRLKTYRIINQCQQSTTRWQLITQVYLSLPGVILLRTTTSRSPNTSMMIYRWVWPLLETTQSVLMPFTKIRIAFCLKFLSKVCWMFRTLTAKYSRGEWQTRYQYRCQVENAWVCRQQFLRK